MLPDRVSNPGPLTYESGALPIALRGPAPKELVTWLVLHGNCSIIPANPYYGFHRVAVEISV